MNDTNSFMRRLFVTLLWLAALLIALTGLCAFASWQKDESLRKLQHTFRVLYVQSDLLSACQDLNLASRGYVLSRDKQFKNIFDAAAASVDQYSSEIEQLTAGSADQQRRLDEFKRHAKLLRVRSEAVWKSADNATISSESKLAVIEQKQAMDSVRKSLSSIRDEEKGLISQRDAFSQSQETFFWLSIAILAITGLVLLFLMRQALVQYKRESDLAYEKVSQSRDAAEAARKNAEQALAAKGLFLSTLSHEVRTPMAGVIGLVELIFVSAQSDDMRKLANVALQACKRLLQILNDLLDASKLQAGAVTLEHRFFSVRPVIGDLVQLSLAEATKKGIEVTPTVSANVPDIVCGDELRLRQILQNLVFNAVKFTDIGKVSIHVELVNKTATIKTLKFSVTDTGCGISPDQQERIFEPFTQANDSTTRVYGGTGLGLNIARTLVDLMEGEIGVNSQVGDGSTFWVVLSFRDDLCSTA